MCVCWEGGGGGEERERGEGGRKRQADRRYLKPPAICSTKCDKPDTFSFGSNIFY